MSAKNIATRVCVECSDTFHLNWMPETREKMDRRGLCFSCNFWQDHIERRDDPNVARINGNHYMIGPETPGGMRGYDGTKFVIRFTDGREVVTTNLWCQGNIPERFRDRLPNNAEFIR